MTREEMRRAPLADLEAEVGEHFECPATVEGLMQRLGQMDGGEFDLYKPGVALSYYEHDDCCCVYVTPCKMCPVECGRGEAVIITPVAYGDHAVRHSLLMAILTALESGARP